MDSGLNKFDLLISVIQQIYFCNHHSSILFLKIYPTNITSYNDIYVQDFFRKVSLYFLVSKIKLAVMIMLKNFYFGIKTIRKIWKQIKGLFLSE